MTAMLEKLNSEKVAAMKQKLKATPEEKSAVELRLAVLRGVIGEIERDSKEKKPRGALAIMKSEHKKRVDTAGTYAEVGEVERSARETEEAVIISEFLPREPGAEELQTFIEEALEDEALKAQGNKAMGAIMKSLRAEFENFDGKLASQLIREALNS